MNKPPHGVEDPCDALLRSALQNAARPLLWVTDEHIVKPSHWLKSGAAGVTIISNRYDSFLDAKLAGISAHFNDMDFSITTGAFKSVVYRISKEKALVHHIINDSLHTLQAGGSLYLIGGKQEGIKTYIDKAHEYFGHLQAQEIGHHSTRLAQLQVSPVENREPLDDKDYSRFRPIGEENGLQFYSKPGQFGWDKMDQGSRYLVEHFDSFFSNKKPGHALDLGCGYGYLALYLSHYLPETLTATDNNAAALASCKFNFERNGVHQGTTVADDCGRHLQINFDTVICNPPFHQGFSTSGEMTDRFLEQTRRLLKPTGTALFVVNQFIPLEQKAASLFKEIECFAHNKSFKLVRLAKPNHR